MNHREKKLLVQTRRAVITRTNNRYMTKPERAMKLKSYKNSVKSAMQRMARMKSLLVANVEMNGMELDSETHNDLLQIMKERSSEIASKFPRTLSVSNFGNSK